MLGGEKKRPAVISIGAGASQLPLIIAAKKMGWDVIAVDRDPNAPGFEFVDVGIRESTHDTATMIAALNEIRASYEFGGVVARTTAAEALCTSVLLGDDYT